MANAISSSKVEALISRLRKADARAVESVTKAMKQSAYKILGASQHLVPRDTGALFESGRVEINDVGIHGSTINVIYGDETAWYALYVHQIPPPMVEHGAAFNLKHAAEIAAGKEKRRRPQEKFNFLWDAMHDPSVKIEFQKELVKNGIPEN